MAAFQLGQGGIMRGFGKIVHIAPAVYKSLKIIDGNSPDRTFWARGWRSWRALKPSLGLKCYPANAKLLNCRRLLDGFFCFCIVGATNSAAVACAPCLLCCTRGNFGGVIAEIFEWNTSRGANRKKLTKLKTKWNSGIGPARFRRTVIFPADLMGFWYIFVFLYRRAHDRSV